MPEISIDSDTGTGFEVQLKIDLKKKSTSDNDTLDNQTIESINEQLYVDNLRCLVSQLLMLKQIVLEKQIK